jgi:hypothetical protein
MFNYKFSFVYPTFLNAIIFKRQFAIETIAWKVKISFQNENEHIFSFSLLSLFRQSTTVHDSVPD